MDKIRGIITKILKESDNGRSFVVIRYETPQGQVTAKMGGWLKELSVGDSFAAQGDWSESLYRGKKEDVFNAKRVRPDRPRTPDSITDYLRTIFDETRHGITVDAVRKLVSSHGAETLDRIDDDPEILVGISKDPTRFRNAILTEYGRRSSSRRAVSLMDDAGIKEHVISRVLEAYKDATLNVLRENPYEVAQIPEVGFSNADKIGQHLGVPAKDDRRLAAAVENVLKQESEKGSTFAVLHDLLVGLSRTIDVDERDLVDFLRNGANNPRSRIMVDLRKGKLVAALRHLLAAENRIASGVARLLKGNGNDPEKVASLAERVLKDTEFDDTQRRAVVEAATQPIFVLVGGPGTGKTTVMKSVVELCEAVGDNVFWLTAPTGKASKRLKETTERKTQTLHRLLLALKDTKTGKSIYRRNADNPLPAGSVVVIDESSMVDVELMAALFDAMPADGRLIIVGDRNQLPSVGPGAVLADMLTAQVGGRFVIPSVELTKNYRTAHNSKIATDAMHIRDGMVPFVDSRVRGGVVFHEVETRDISAHTRRMVTQVLAKPLKIDGTDAPARQLDPRTEICVLCPQAPGPGGTWEINRMLSAELNPNGRPLPGVRPGPHDDPRMPIPRVGDRVMLTGENDDKRDITNGDVGTLVDCIEKRRGSTTKPYMVVEFDTGERVEYPISKWRSLILAYAMTVHKSQGSQYPVVILPMTLAHETMLDRPLLYTGWTRAQNLVMVVGEREALELAVETQRSTSRRTRTKETIEDCIQRLGMEPRGERVPFASAAAAERKPHVSAAEPARAAAAPPRSPFSLPQLPTPRRGKEDKEPDPQVEKKPAGRDRQPVEAAGRSAFAVPF